MWINMWDNLLGIDNPVIDMWDNLGIHCISALSHMSIPLSMSRDAERDWVWTTRRRGQSVLQTLLSSSAASRDAERRAVA
jgi:hypothetical protein